MLSDPVIRPMTPTVIHPLCVMISLLIDARDAIWHLQDRL